MDFRMKYVIGIAITVLLSIFFYIFFPLGLVVLFVLLNGFLLIICSLFFKEEDHVSG